MGGGEGIRGKETTGRLPGPIATSACRSGGGRFSVSESRSECMLAYFLGLLLDRFAVTVETMILFCVVGIRLARRNGRSWLLPMRDDRDATESDRPREMGRTIARSGSGGTVMVLSSSSSSRPLDPGRDGISSSSGDG